MVRLLPKLECSNEPVESYDKRQWMVCLLPKLECSNEPVESYDKRQWMVRLLPKLELVMSLLNHILQYLKSLHASNT